MKIFKYAAIVLALATGLAGCDKNEHTLCDEKDIGGAVAIMNEYLAGQPKDWDFNEKIDDLGEWLKKYPCCYGGINQYCESCVIVSVPDGVNNPFGHEFHINFKNKKYVLYFSAKEPFGIVDYVDYDERYLPADPNISDPTKAIMGTWKLIAMDDKNDPTIRPVNGRNFYTTMEFLSNGSYRTFVNYDHLVSSILTNVGLFRMEQEFLIQEIISSYYIDTMEECYKYSFFDEDKLRLERCVPWMPDWYDDMRFNTVIFQRIK